MPERNRHIDRSEIQHYPDWKQNLYEVIFGTESFWGKSFDIILLVAILLSLIAVMFESVASIYDNYGAELLAIEWVFTILFTIEYILRILVVRNSWKYVFSFYGIVDFMAILPTYLGFLLADQHGFLAIRILRLLRVFRIFKLVRFIGEAEELGRALYASRHKISVFFGSVLSIVTILGTLMYLIEGGKNGFTDIPTSIYWAIITLTTVGYGDIVPVTHAGQAVASIIMILGYSIIAVPTGIITAQMTFRRKLKTPITRCPACGKTGHEHDAEFCKHCGSKL